MSDGSDGKHIAVPCLPTKLVTSRIILEYTLVFDNEPISTVSQMLSFLEAKLREAQIKDTGEVLDMTARLMTMKVTHRSQTQLVSYLILEAQKSTTAPRVP